MVIVIEKFLLVVGLEKGLDSELTFEVVRHFTKCVGENKVVLCDPRISLDNFNLGKSELKIQGKP